MIGQQKQSTPLFPSSKQLQNLNGATIDEILENCDIEEETVNRYLDTLIQQELIALNEDKYVLGIRFIDIGRYTKTRNTAFELAEEKVEYLAKETNERAQFIVEEHGKGIYVHREIGQHGIRTDPGVGKQTPLHATAAGKAILAYLPRSRAEELIEEEDLEKLTDDTITDPNKLNKELEKIRERGYSLNQEENIKGLYAVAAPVLDPEGGIIGALSVSGPKKRMSGDRFQKELPELLMGVANELEINIAHINNKE